METMTKSISMAFILGAVAFAGAVAQAADIPARGPVTFAAYDADGNGSISEQEFNAVRDQREAERAATGRPGFGAANAPAFSEVDTNGDGQISPAELSAAQQAQWQKNSMGRGMGRR
jgi:hypothetical protein